MNASSPLALLAFLAIVAAVTIVGRTLARRAGLPHRGGEGFAYAYALGTGVVSLAILAACALPGPRAGRALAAVLVAVAAALLVDARDRRAGRPCGSLRVGCDRTTVVAQVVGALLLVGACAPETGWDALAYHLPAAYRVARDGPGAMVGLLDGEGRLGFDLLFAPALGSWDAPPRGPALLHAFAGLALACALHAEVARRAGRRAAGIVAALWLACPVVADATGTAYVDLGVGLHGFVALAAAARALRGEPGRNVVAAGCLAGFAANDKLPAASWIAVVAVALVVGLGVRRGRVAATTAALVALAATGPWLVRALGNTGNPVFPALASTLGTGWADAPTVDASTRQILAQTGLARGPWLPVAGTFHGAYDARFAFEFPIWILALAPLACVLRPTREARGLVVAGVVAWLAWGFVVPYARFGYGVLAWAAVAAGVGGARLADAWPRLRPLIAIGAVVLLALQGRDAWRTQGRVRAAVLGPVVARGAGPARFQADGVVHEPSWEAARTAPGRVAVLGAPAGVGGPDAVSLEGARNGLARDDDLADPRRLRALLARCGAVAVVHRLDAHALRAPALEGLRALLAGDADGAAHSGPPPLAPPRRHDWFWSAPSMGR